MIDLGLIKKATEKHYARSSAPGGQNVNKKETKVQLTFDIMHSALSDADKHRLLRSFSNGFIRVSNEETRYQGQNTRLAFEKLQELIETKLKRKKARRTTLAPFMTDSGKQKRMRKANLLKYKKRFLLSKD